MYKHGDNIMIVRLTNDEYETKDGKIYSHCFDFETLPSLEEFNVLYKQSEKHLNNIINDVENIDE